MQGILSPYLWLFMLVYIDNIVAFSSTFEQHISHLDKVLQAIEENGLTLSPSKCHFFYSSILLLDHKVFRLELSTHEEKVNAILELKQLSKVSELQSFLGMLIYFQTFIPFFTDCMGPLFEKLRKGSVWNWSEEQEHAWNSGKQALQEAPILGHVQEGLLYRLYTDTSDQACRCTGRGIQCTDLKGTKAYTTLEKAWGDREPVPQMYNKIITKHQPYDYSQNWSTKFKDTEIWTEQVIGYYSR